MTLPGFEQPMNPTPESFAKFQRQFLLMTSMGNVPSIPKVYNAGLLWALFPFPLFLRKSYWSLKKAF